MFRAVIALIFMLTATALAQQTPASPPSVETPVLTEVQQLTLELIALQDQLREVLKQNAALKAEIGRLHEALAPLQEEKQRAAIRQRLDALKVDVERGHPGFAWNPQTGFTVKPADPKKDPRQE